jgi:hypothetical protein
MITRFLVLLTCGAVGFAPATLPAQQASSVPAVVDSIAPGTHVRVWRKDRFATPRYVRGPLKAVTSDSLIVESRRTESRISLALDSVSRVEISTQRASRTGHVKVGAGLGAAAGAALGFGFGALLNGLCEDGVCRGDARPYTTALGALGGAALGAGIAAIFPGRMQWRDVPLRR